MNFSQKLTHLVALFALLTFSCAHAQEWNEFKAQPASSVKIEGTSTIHDWTMEGNIIGGSLKLRKDFQLEPTAKLGKLEAQALVNIPVRSLKSGKATMDEIMQEAMLAKENPKIEYTLMELHLKQTPTGGTGAFIFEAVGELSMSGRTNRITMPVEITKINPVRLEIRGKKALKMTDYGIKPPAPSIAGGLIKTGDDVTITFVWKVAVPVKAQ